MKYKCGHSKTTIILDDNELSLSAYLEWKDTVGWNGDKTLCWDCWCSECAKLKIWGMK